MEFVADMEYIIVKNSQGKVVPLEHDDVTAVHGQDRSIVVA